MNDPFTELRNHWERCAAEQPDFRSPEESELLEQMHQRHESLRKLGWNDAIYCPKDGTIFLSISAGSTGIHECYYDGEWPTGSWWVQDAGDLWPARPILWKPLPAKEN